jgi:HAE1 family hydrophobic/amphiphilic exporter-1
VHLLSVFSLRNRALIALVTIVVGLFGGIALSSLKQELIPSLSLPQVFIVTAYPGATPDVVNTDVSTPIESAIQAVPGLDGTTATSNANFSTITASFNYGTDITTAEQKIQLAINRISSQLPANVDPQVLTFSFSDLPVVQIAVTSDLDPRELTAAINNSTLGGTTERVSITPDADELLKAGLTTQSIRDALDANGVLLPSGQITEDGKTLTVQAGSRIGAGDEIGALPLLGGNGDVRTISDVSAVAVINDPVTGISRVNGEPSITIAVTKSPA